MTNPTTVAQPGRSGETRGWSLALLPLLPLSAVYGVQYLDQILLGLFVQPIKAELGLSDTQIGLLTGAAFTMLYTTLGVPLARVADRHNRKWLIVACTILFSLATALSGLATGFLTLCLARMAVAIGEAGTMPAAVSMLADVYRSGQRRLVMSLHSCGGFLATALGLLAASQLSATVGWRLVFLIVGCAGIVLALVFALVVKEPERQEAPDTPQNLGHDMKHIFRIPAFSLLALGLGVGAIASSAMINWFPAFLARSQHVPQPQIVLYLAIAWGCAATSGSIFFGLLSTWLHNRGGRLPLFSLGTLIFVFASVACLAFMSTSTSSAVTAFTVAVFLMGGVRGPAFAVVQDIIPPQMRATAISVFMFSMYFIGVTLGPLATGLISDFLGATEGSNALRHALLIVVALSGGAAGALIIAAGFFYPVNSVKAD